MPSIDHDLPADRPLRHRHSNSSASALVPMWDSSDPERAPPPLPRNPQSPSVNVGTSRAGTSLAIQNAHAALNEKARENARATSPYKRNPDISPERLLGQRHTPSSHRRMQSLQPGSVRDISQMIEAARESASPTNRGLLDKDRLTPRTSPEKLTPRASLDMDRAIPRVSLAKDRFPRPATPSHNRENEKDVKPAEKPTEKPTEKETTASIGSTGTSDQKHSTNASSVTRSTARWPQPSIFGENTPPQSATMLALNHGSSQKDVPSQIHVSSQIHIPSQIHVPSQIHIPSHKDVPSQIHIPSQNHVPSLTPRESETPLATVTNNAVAITPKSPATNEYLANQLVTLTNIANSLHREMTALSRRSRDNATDLMSLKEATHARDEDIRKSLRDLVTNVDAARYHREGHTSGLFIENKPFNNPDAAKTHRSSMAFQRIPSPNGVAASIDKESLLSTPSLIGSDVNGSMALLDKIIKDMGTKEGQDTMFDRLSELAERLNSVASGMASAQKVEELLDHVKSLKEERALVRVTGGNPNALRNLSFDSISEGSTEGTEWHQNHSDVGPKDERITNDKEGDHVRTNEVINDDLLKIIHSVKDSVAQGGGLTAEVKALVRELRGEVLGMGRELGRKLEENGVKPSHSKSEASSKAELAKIVEESLEQMKVYMQQRLREHRRNSIDSDTSEAENKPTVDYQEIYNAMRSAINDAHEHDGHATPLSRDDVLNAVKDAWESYKPEIEVQQVGLGREEVLACIKEGLQEVRQGGTKSDVRTVVSDGAKGTEPLSRDEVLDAVRECLEEFEFPVAPSAFSNDLSREDMMHAVKQALDEFDFPDLNKALVPHDGRNAEILDRLHDIMEYMHDELKLQHVVQYLQSEFKILSEEARRNMSANEQNTEHVLDATRSGFESLRTRIEEYVDRVAEHSGPASPEDLTDLVNSFKTFRDELSQMMTKTTDQSRDLIKQEIESLRDAVNSSLVPHVPPPSDNREIFEAIRESLNQVRNDVLRPHAGTTDILDALHEGFSDIRACVEKVTDKPVDLTANDEILDALRSGLDDIRADIETLRGATDNERALTTVNLNSPTDLIKHDDIKNLEGTVHEGIKNIEAVMAQLQAGMEALNAAAQAKAPLMIEEGVSKMDLAELEHAIRDGLSREDLDRLEKLLQKAVSKEDLTKLEDLLREGLAKDALKEEKADKTAMREDLNTIKEVIDRVGSKDDLNELGDLLRKVQQAVARVAKDRDAAKDVELASKDDVIAIETILRNTKGRLDDFMDGEHEVRKLHVDAVGDLVQETKDSFGALTSRLESFPRKEDLAGLAALISKITSGLGEMREINAAHFASLPSRDDIKNIEDLVRGLRDLYGIQADRSTDVGALLEKFQSKTKEKLDVSGDNVVSLGLVLESLRASFAEFKANVASAKMDSDEKMQSAAVSLQEKMGAKIDGLVAKYEDFQLVMDDRTRAGESRDIEMEAAVAGTKAVTEEVKVLMDNLGVTVTDSLEKMEEASKTVFDQVELLYGKSEDYHADDKHEHQVTREQVKQVIGAVEDLQGHVSEYQPKILDAVKDVLLIAGQQYEHSHAKLAHLDTLDNIHQQVVRTAAEITEFLASQKLRVENEYEDREKTLQDTALALERQRAEQEYVVANLTMLRDEETQIRENVMALRAEQDLLTRQKTRLTADVSSLETAIQLRREELHAMDARVEALERRILEGVLDHSRALLMTKSGAKGREAMSRKRVANSNLGGGPQEENHHQRTQSPAPSSTADTDGKQVTTTTSAKYSSASTGIGATMAVKSNRVTLLQPQNYLRPSHNNSPATSRRILSLSQMQSNANINNHSYRTPPAALLAAAGIKRTQSARTPVTPSRRNASWVAGTTPTPNPTTTATPNPFPTTPTRGRAGAGKGYGALGKENVPVENGTGETESSEEEENYLQVARITSSSTEEIEDDIDDERRRRGDDSDIGTTVITETDLCSECERDYDDSASFISGGMSSSDEARSQ